MEENRVRASLDSDMVVRIEVDPEGKQLLILKSISQEAAVVFSQVLERWLETSAPVLVMAVDPDVSIELVHIGEDSEDHGE